MTDETIRIGMWAGPRNISTTMMRAFENRPDTDVIDEPFYAFYLRRSGADHPMREKILEALPQSFDGVVSLLNGPAPKGSMISFHKHIAYHASAHDELPLEWIDGQRTFILIRDPRLMVASYAQKYDDVGPILSSLEVKEKVYAHVTGQGKPCPIVDAADILKNPEGMLRALCKALDIPFTDAMLAWPEGARSSDGIWGDHWYDSVRASTGFRPFEDKAVSLTPDLETFARACDDEYQAFYEKRLVG